MQIQYSGPQKASARLDGGAGADPLVPLLIQYRAALAAHNAADGETPDEAVEGWEKAWREVYRMEAYPAPTTAEGAALALRVALGEGRMINRFAEEMVEAALAFLDSQSPTRAMS